MPDKCKCRRNPSSPCVCNEPLKSYDWCMYRQYGAGHFDDEGDPLHPWLVPCQEPGGEIHAHRIICRGELLVSADAICGARLTRLFYFQDEKFPYLSSVGDGLTLEDLTCPKCKEKIAEE